MLTLALEKKNDIKIIEVLFSYNKRNNVESFNMIIFRNRAACINILTVLGTAKEFKRKAYMYASLHSSVKQFPF